MKYFLLSLFVFIASSLWVMASTAKIKGTTINAKEAESKWGNAAFNAQSFKVGSLDLRAKMAAELLKEKSHFIGKPKSEIRTQLGDYSGFYFSSLYPTYLIQETSETSDEAWQIVFIIDAKGFITDVVVHKNCCEK